MLELARDRTAGSLDADLILEVAHSVLGLDPARRNGVDRDYFEGKHDLFDPVSKQIHQWLDEHDLL